MSEALPLDLTCSAPVDFSQPQRKMSPVAIGLRWDAHSSDVWWRRGSPTSGARPSLYWLRHITSRRLLSLFYVVWRQACNRDVSFTSHVVAATWQASRSGEGTEYIRKRGVVGSEAREDGELNLDWRGAELSLWTSKCSCLTMRFRAGFWIWSWNWFMLLTSARWVRLSQNRRIRGKLIMPSVIC